MQSEFNQLDDESNIYKLVGPVLLKQEKSEALMAVNGRLEFIEKEMWVSQPNVYSHSSLTRALARELRRKSMKSRKRARRSALRYREPPCNSTPRAHADLRLDRAGPNSGPTASCLCLCMSLSNFERTSQWRKILAFDLESVVDDGWTALTPHAMQYPLVDGFPVQLEWMHSARNVKEVIAFETDDKPSSHKEDACMHLSVPW